MPAGTAPSPCDRLGGTKDHDRACHLRAETPAYTDLRVTPPDTTETSTVATTIEACVLLVHPVT
jgi:hypothetical protein